MYDVQINPIKNRLYITLGDGNYTDIAVYVNEIERACRYTAPGFTCVIGLNKKGLIRKRDKDVLFNTACLVYAYGASKIVYVRKNNDNLDLFQRSLMDFQIDLTVENAKNIQEAEDILNERKLGRNELKIAPN